MLVPNIIKRKVFFSMFSKACGKLKMQFLQLVVNKVSSKAKFYCVLVLAPTGTQGILMCFYMSNHPYGTNLSRILEHSIFIILALIFKQSSCCLPKVFKSSLSCLYLVHASFRYSDHLFFKFSKPHKNKNIHLSLRVHLFTRWPIIGL